MTTLDIIIRLLDNAAFVCVHAVGRFSKDFLEVRGLRSRGFQLQVEWMTTVLCAELWKEVWMVMKRRFSSRFVTKALLNLASISNFSKPNQASPQRNFGLNYNFTFQISSTYISCSAAFWLPDIRELKQTDTAAERRWWTSKFLFKRTEGQVNLLGPWHHSLFNWMEIWTWPPPLSRQVSLRKVPITFTRA